MKFTVEGSGQTWSVGGYDSYTDGHMMAFFHGQNAEERARAYARWLNEPEEVSEQMRQIRRNMADIGEAMQNMRVLSTGQTV